jgi:hypothetical protein
MLHPLLENVLQAVDHFKISCLGAPFSWLGKPRNRMGRDLVCMADVLMGFHRSTFPSPTQNSIQISPHAISEEKSFEVINGLQHVFETWVERCKKCIACQGRYFEKRPSLHLHEVPTRTNKVSPRTFANGSRITDFKNILTGMSQILLGVQIPSLTALF